jgi:hypothetical protein
MQCGNSYAVSYFLPIVLMQGLGFDVAKAQTLTAPVSISPLSLSLSLSLPPRP